MIKSEQASLSVMRIAAITLIAIFMLSVCVFASSVDMKNVKIVLADNCEIDVLTTKTKVSDILEENHIVVLPEENVVPNLDSDINDSYSKIVITGVTQDAYSVVAIAEEEESIRLDQLLSSYNTITEKIVVVEEAIPFETVTENLAGSSDATVEKVTQEGKEGLKRSTYKAKYQNDIEINRTLINEEVVEEPVNKIIHITKVTNRSANANTRTASKTTTSSSKNNSLASRVEGKEPIVKTMNASAYSAADGGKSVDSPGYGKTASGATATAWYTVAAGSSYPIGTIIYIPHFASSPNRWMVYCSR